jgi:8-oxo-dGTP pyrophosphatase MutT (NUDIX family)
VNKKSFLSYSRNTMLLGSPPHHNTGNFTSHRKFLADKEYGEALDTLVKACSDMLLISPDGNKIFLGKRLVQPQPDWWFVGGRVFPGETPAQSCCRLLRRELSLEIDPMRLNPVCCQSLCWGMREQLPKENGTCDSQVVLSLQLTEAEVEKVVLDPKEYESSQWIEPKAVITGDFHPALRFAVQSLLGARKLNELQAAIATQADNDVEIARLARELVELTSGSVPNGESDYRVRAPALQYECGVTSQY